jgi:tryptophanyl-tRNA synthetase
MSDSQEELSKKIREKAFSGGGMTKQEHIEKGANLMVDVAYHYLLYFLDSDKELEHIAIEYRTGRMMTSEVKKKAIDVIGALLKEHQEARARVTSEVVQTFMNPHREFDHKRHPKEALAATIEEQHLGFHFDPYFKAKR